ncbi:MAG: hypothetical protein IJU54_02495 [Alphaproteobacteria bacterium]|nr:hypothetical protein [Alphaproteobacteria bacterium]
MEKNHIIIILTIIIAILSIILCYAFLINNNNINSFERINLSSTCSIELPQIHFDVDNNTMSSSYAGITTEVYGRTFTSNNLIIQYTHVSDNTGLSVNGIYTGNSQMNIGNSNWYSREVTNIGTGESIIVCGENKELVDRIANSIHFSKGFVVNNTPTVGDSNVNTSNIIGYDAQFNPIYEGQDTSNLIYDAHGRQVRSLDYSEVQNPPADADEGYWETYYADQPSDYPTDDYIPSEPSNSQNPG